MIKAPLIATVLSFAPVSLCKRYWREKSERRERKLDRNEDDEDFVKCVMYTYIETGMRFKVLVMEQKL